METSTADEPPTVVSVRLHGDELAKLEDSSTAAGIPLSTFIRQCALGAASSLDLRVAIARAEAIRAEARKLVALLHGDVA